MIYDANGNALSSCYDASGNPLSTAYDATGNVVFTAGGGIPDYTNYTVTNYLTESALRNMQGFDIYDGVLFQFRADSSSVHDLMNTYSTESGDVLATGISITSAHGDSASFSDDFYDPADRFPLLYVTSDATPALIYVNRVTTTSASLVRTLKFPTAQAGYYAAAALDADNNIIYLVGYTENSAVDSNNGSNKMLVSKWDLTNLTDNGDGTYTPEFVSSYQRSFIYVTQGQQYRNGVIWMTSGYTDASHGQMVYGMDAETGEMLYTIDTELSIEIEGLAFLDDYRMVVGFWRGTYKLYTFAEVE